LFADLARIGLAGAGFFLLPRQRSSRFFLCEKNQRATETTALQKIHCGIANSRAQAMC
jgi:hypothetical protein